jgi:hypothetical protein
MKEVKPLLSLLYRKTEKEKNLLIVCFIIIKERHGIFFFWLKHDFKKKYKEKNIS